MQKLPCKTPYHPSANAADPSETLLPLRIYALGTASVYRGEYALTAADWTYARPRELFFCLLLRRFATKEQLGLALWPDASALQLRRSFHTTLHHLRRALGPSDWIVYEHQRYTFNRRLPYWFDVEEFEAHFAEGKRLESSAPERAIACFEAAAGLYEGELLEGMIQSEWCLQRREELHRRFVEALFALGQLLSTIGRSLQAADVYLRIVSCDNLLERAHRELMRCYACLGETGLALRQYQTLVHLLRRELDSPPAAETTRLFEELRRGENL
ncbi:AfsR/SARP family transcriptional regulator [Gloeobacter violaceus]|uniref:AfsR/SARP family transcriptional regulator n=1 Tax=Gloeobacter violaceus TaxID=33072 RepID=UPI00030C8387|nr:BTAD domain-containing putative transcriptional regulator [Gloeobacter violaceus]